MLKGRITSDEIALIKAMLVRKMKNKDIQFFFNRPDRPVNSGRIGVALPLYVLTPMALKDSDRAVPPWLQ
ncbi:MAG TPA: hypothetical protein VGL35_02415 [Rhizomicrobium sp.]|jgi:hypothetical protein